MATFPEMVHQSIDILRLPNELNFNKYEHEGNVTHALLFMGFSMAAFVGLGVYMAGATGALQHLLLSVVYYFGFAGLSYLIGRRIDGEGTWSEVAYTHALFMAPILLIFTCINLIAFSFGNLEGARPYFTALALYVTITYSVRCLQATMNIYDPRSMWVVAALLGVSGVFFKLFH